MGERNFDSILTPALFGSLVFMSLFHVQFNPIPTCVHNRMVKETGLVMALVCRLVSSGILLEHRAIGVHNYVSLVADVHDYYKTSCVMFFQLGNYNHPSAASLMHLWFLEFSRRGIFSVASTIPKLVNDSEKYYNRIPRPLFVVLLDTKESMNEFALATMHLRISFPVWLVLFMQQPGNPLKEFCQHPKGNPFNLIFNTEMLVLCYDHPILKEWYAQRDNTTRISNLASWSPESGFIPFSKKTLYARRGDMFGKSMRIMTVENSPFVAMKDGVLSGFVGRTVEELRTVMNFTMDTQTRTAVRNAGCWNEEQQAWTHGIAEISAGRIDLGIGIFTVTRHRLQAVDFTIPLLLTRTRVYIQEPSSSTVEWSQYFKAFDYRTWAVVVGLVATAPILLTVIKTRGHFSVRVMVDSYMQVWGIYCQQGLSEFPNESSVRLAFFSIFISALIVCSAYSASLISYLTMATATLPFNTLEGFVDDGTYKLIVVKNTADHDLFMMTQDCFFLRLQALMKSQKELPRAVSEAFHQVCTERVGFYVAAALKNAYNLYLPCKLTHIETGNVESLALMLTKSNPYIGLINYHLQRFQDYGILNRLRTAERFRPVPQESKHDAVTISAVAPILAVLAGGMILGCLLLLVENVVFFKLNNTEATELNHINSEKALGISDTLKSPDASMPDNGKALKRCNEPIVQSDYEMLHFGYRP